MPANHEFFMLLGLLVDHHLHSFSSCSSSFPLHHQHHLLLFTTSNSLFSLIFYQIDTLYGCTIGGCQSKFENENELSNHYQTVHRLDLAYLSKQSNLFPTQSGDKNENSLPSNEISKTKIRKYPCGYPGCQWVFTRTNHVVRHHERVHPGFRPPKTSSEQSLMDVKKKGVTAYMCHKTDCKQIFSNPILLKNHIKLSHETNSNIDDISSAIKFKTSNGLKLR